MSTAFQQYQDGPLSPAAFGRNTVEEDDIVNRFGYHKGSSITIPQHERVRQQYIALALALKEIIPDGAARKIWLDQLQTSAMWANFAVAEQSPLEEPPIRTQRVGGPGASSAGTGAGTKGAC